MKYCPECQANVEGLLKRCDCCGASLLPRKKEFFGAAIYEVDGCYNFASIVREIISAIQPAEPEKYSDFLGKVCMGIICYPQWMHEDGNIKKKLSLYYSPKQKYANLTIVVDYKQFIAGDTDKRKCLVAAAVQQGIHLLQDRVKKYKENIDDLVIQTDAILFEYMHELSTK